MAIKGYWRFNGNSNDASGNGYNGTDTAITYSQANGRLNQGAGFNGSSSYILLPNSARSGNSLTISLFFKQNSYSGSVIWIESASVYALIGTTANGGLELHNKTTATSYTVYTSSDALIKTTGFNHAVYNYDAATGYLNGYLNGKLVISVYRGGNQQYLDNQTNHVIGCYSYNNHVNRSGYFSGAIDEMKSLNESLPPAKVKNEYSRAIGFF